MSAEESKGHIVLIDDDAGSRMAMGRALQRCGFRVVMFGDGLSALAYVREHPDVELVVTDLVMPGIDGVEVLRRAREIVSDVGMLMITAKPEVESAVKAMQQGAADYLPKPVNRDLLNSRASNLVEKVRLQREVNAYRSVTSTLAEMGSFAGMVGQSPAMLELYRKIQQVAEARSSVLILGESGTGKELVARAIHCQSNRARETFLPVDCAAIPNDILESELFGHERGAFTGAQSRKPGKFELANGGTLFLDEIGELPLGLQAKLLRALETQTFMRVGGTEQVKVDVRLIAATNRNLLDDADRGEFRQDLYYRLAVVTLRIPPLRERREDVPRLAGAFLERFARENDREPPDLAAETIETLMLAPWPGNVRELRNLMESLVVLHGGSEVLPQHLPDEIRRAVEAVGPEALADAAAKGMLLGRSMDEIEREAILRTLEQTAGNRTQAAEILGIGLRTLQRKIKQYRGAGFKVTDTGSDYE